MDGSLRDISILLARTDGTTARIPIDQESIVIGRAAETDVRIALLTVAPRHCRIFVGKDIILEAFDDADTWVNGEPVSRVSLRAGDRVRVGTVEFTIAIGAPIIEVPPQRAPDSMSAPKQADAPEVSG